MKAGDFAFTMTNSTPDSVLAELYGALGWTGDTSAWGVRDGHIVVTDNRLAHKSMASTSVARYTGILTKLKGTEFTGRGLAAWLGSTGLPTDIRTSALTKTTATLDGWLTDILPHNSITKGTVTNTGSTLTGTWHWTSGIEGIDWVCDQVGAEWLINPDGTLDAAATATLFAATPTVMVTDQPEGESGPIRGVTGGIVSVTIDAEHLTETVQVVADGEGATTNTATITHGSDVAKALAGTTTHLERILDDSSLDSANLRTQAGQQLLDQYKTPRWSMTANVVSDRIRSHLKPGDLIYVAVMPAGTGRGAARQRLSPGRGDGNNQISNNQTPSAIPLLQDLNSATVMFRGQPYRPVIVRVVRCSWNVTNGMGVYLIRDQGTESITDLSPYIQYSLPGASLELVDQGSQGQGDGNNRFGGRNLNVWRGQQARYHPATVERLVNRP